VVVIARICSRVNISFNKGIAATEIIEHTFVADKKMNQKYQVSLLLDQDFLVLMGI
jgi:hypothetical protein